MLNYSSKTGGYKSLNISSPNLILGDKDVTSDFARSLFGFFRHNIMLLLVRAAQYIVSAVILWCVQSSHSNMCDVNYGKYHKPITLQCFSVCCREKRAQCSFSMSWRSVSVKPAANLLSLYFVAVNWIGTELLWGCGENKMSVSQSNLNSCQYCSTCLIEYTHRKLSVELGCRLFVFENQFFFVCSSILDWHSALFWKCETCYKTGWRIEPWKLPPCAQNT